MYGKKIENKPLTFFQAKKIMASLLKKSKGANNATTHTDWRRSADFTCTVCRKDIFPKDIFQ